VELGWACACRPKQGICCAMPCGPPSPGALHGKRGASCFLLLLLLQHCCLLLLAAAARKAANRRSVCRALGCADCCCRTVTYQTKPSSQPSPPSPLFPIISQKRRCLGWGGSIVCAAAGIGPKRPPLESVCKKMGRLESDVSREGRTISNRIRSKYLS
jgi:hypothetical protein